MRFLFFVFIVSFTVLTSVACGPDTQFEEPITLFLNPDEAPAWVSYVEVLADVAGVGEGGSVTFTVTGIDELFTDRWVTVQTDSFGTARTYLFFPAIWTEPVFLFINASIDGYSTPYEVLRVY